MLGEEVACNGLKGCVVQILVAFYVDDGLIASCDPVWLQESFDILIGLIEWIGLFTNAAKTKSMVCIPGQIREGYMEEGYAEHKSQTDTPTSEKRVKWTVRFAVPALRLDLTTSGVTAQQILVHLNQDIVVNINL